MVEGLVNGDPLHMFPCADLLFSTKVAALVGIGACFYFGGRRVVNYTFGSVGGPAVSGISELP